MAIPLLPIVLGLAQYAPQVMRFFGAGQTSEKVAEQVAGIAMQVSGATTPADALIAVKANAELQAKFQERALELDHQMELAYLNDVQDARKRDTLLAQLGRRNWRPDIMFFLAVATILALVIMIWSAKELDEYVKGIFTLVLGRFLGYLDNIYNFEFGTTRSSKTKDLSIEQLSRK